MVPTPRARRGGPQGARGRRGPEQGRRRLQAERQLEDLGDQVDADSKGRIEEAIKEVRDSLESEDPTEINAKTETLQTAFHAISEAMYQRAQEDAAAAGGPGPADSNGASADDAGAEEDVVDAEVVDEPKG